MSNTHAPEAVTAVEAVPGSTLATTICDRVRADILGGRHEPGAKLRLEDLRAEFGVSWSPLREALSRLVAEGLIQTEGQRGYRIAPVSKAALAEVLRLRLMLESMALRESIEKGDDAWEAEVLSAHHRLAKLEDSRWEEASAQDWERWHRTFHDALISACQSPILLQFCAQLHDLNDRYRRLFLSAHKFDRDVAAEHRALVQATLARDAAKACKLLERHIERTGTNLLRSMRD
jgi:DNA-binding GntR family transcriptional regulator